jgi:hypothetical protein
MELSSDATGRQLEDAFFKKRDADLIRKMREREARQSKRKALAEVSGITDETVLDQLVSHDVHVDTLAAFTLAPIIEVAWADGRVQPAERRAILAAVEQNGMHKDGVAFELVAQWLDQRPKPELLTLWKAYVRTLLASLPDEARRKLKARIMDQTRHIADAAGGFLGLNSVSKEETAVLQDLENTFG